MKVKVKKSLEVPPEIKTFTDKALSTPYNQLGQLFTGFQFTFAKGDFHHWVPLFNYLDDYFEKELHPRADLQLDVANGLKARPTFPVANVNAILQFTATILENCSNKHLYGSHDHLGSLLAAPDTSVVLNALQTLVAFVRKTHSSSSRLQASAGINNRLLALCHGWGGKEQGLGLLACASQTQAAVQQGHSQATTLRYVFHDASRPGSASGSQPQQGAAAGNAIELPNVHRFTEDDFQILVAVSRGHELSHEERFVLLCKIRTTRLFGSLEGRQALVSIRLLAFYVLVQSSPSQEEVTSFFANEPEFVSELVSLLQAEKEVPEPIRVLALRALAVQQLMERSRHASVISTISAGGQSGLLSLLMHRSVAALVRPHQVPDRYSLSFVEALLSLIGALVASTTGCSALAEAGLVPALLPLIRDMDPDHVRLVSSCIHILETFMDYSPNAASLFRDLGGLDDMIFRLKAEIGISSDPSSSVEAGQAMQISNDNPEDTSSTADGPQNPSQAMQIGSEEPEAANNTAAGQSAASAGPQGDPEASQAMQPASSNPAAAAPAAASAEAAPSAEPPPVPYHRRVLLKSLLRAIALASYAPGTATRPDEAESRALYQCLRAIFDRATEFGGGLFALAASVMTDLIHHDPLCFRELDAAGLPDAFIAAIKAGVIPSGEAVCSVPNTLVAICLNTGGLAKVSESGALDCFIPILTSKKYLKALQGDTPSVLGAGLDELLRHVTSLRKNGVSMILQVFRTLCAEGGTKVDPQPLPEEGPQSMETEGSTPAAEGTATAEGTAMDVEGAEAGQQASGSEQAAGAEQPALQPAGPSGDVDMTGPPSQEGEAAAASQPQQPGPPGEQAAPATPPGPSAEGPSAAQPPQDPDPPYHLPECISHAARMLDNMSANAETSRLFIQQGGIELLLALYRLPRLPPTFGSSSAAHALTATFRTLTMQHAQPLSKHLSSVLNQQLDQALQSAKDIGDQNVPTMPAAERDAYIRLISSTEGLICLAAAVARNAQHMLLEVSAGATSIITRIGEVERVVLWQACHASHPPADEQFQTFGALAEEERAEQAERLQQQAGQGPMGLQLHNTTEHQSLAAIAPGNGQILPAPAAIAEAIAGTGDADMAAAAAEPRDGLVDASEPASPGDRQDEEGHQAGRARRKTQQALAYEVLVHFTIQIRAFYTAVAKAIQTPVRRREELGTSPTMAMRAAAINMAVVLRENMRYKMLPTPPNVVFGSDLINKKHPRTAILRQLNYATRLLEEMMMVLVDGRRRTCHTLVLNYLVVGHGFTAFLDHFKLVVAWMWTMKESLAPVKHLLKQVPEDWVGVHPAATMVKLERMAATKEGLAKFNAQPDLSEAHALSCFVNVLEAMTEGMLGGLEQLTHASMVLGSPQADTLLVAPVPGAPPTPEGQPAPTAQAFVKKLQASVLAAVMPIWGHYLLPTCCGPMCNMVVTTITSCLDSTLGSASGAGGQPPPPAHAPPDAGLVQQITEMGFSQPRVEEALRRVGHNSVELAMEWLIAHPEDPAAGGSSAGAAASAPAEGDEAQLSQALAASLKAGEPSEDVAEGEAQNLKAMLTPIQLVKGAIAVMERVPDAAFGLSDLVANLCQRDDGKLRNQILEQILINLRGDQSIEMEVNNRSPTNLLAAAHLLTLLLTEHNEVKKTTVAPGFVKCSLQLLTAQVDRLQTRDNPDGDIAIPSWVDALLLALHSMVQSTAKPLEPAAPSGDAAAASPSGASVPQGPDTAAAGLGLVAPASAAALSAAGEASQPSANGNAAQGAAPANAAAPVSQQGNLLESMRESLVRTLEEQHRPGGLLSPEQQDLAAMICIRLLRHVQSRGPDYQRTMSETYHAGTEAAPKSTAHSCLQLLSRLTARHEIALKVLREKGHRLALDLPVSALGPELEPYMTALMRHILEDPATLQAAMEAEIRSTLASQRNSPSGLPRYAAGVPGQTGAAPLHSFLQTLTPVLARDPAIFVNAMAATCKLEEAQSNLLGSGRAMVTLKPPAKAAQPAAPSGPSADEQGAQAPKTPLPTAQASQPSGPPPDTGIIRRPSSQGGSNRGTPKAGDRATPFKGSAMKPGKKLVPASFAEVIDSLLDALQSYKDPVVPQPEAEKSDSQAGPSSMDTDSPTQPAASSAPAASPAENGHAGPSGQAAPNEASAAQEAKAKANRKAANRLEQSRVRQCIFFKMLTEFTLKYGNCIGVLLKADTSASSPKDTAKTPAKAERPGGGTLFRQLMFNYLVGLTPGNAVAAAMAEHCSFFLLAVCIRSAEGRNRIVSEIVKTLRGDNPYESPSSNPPESLPFRDAPQQPSPILLKPFVDLAGSLLQALQPSPNNRSLGSATGLFQEMILTMRKAGITKAIINSIRLIDMEHPGAPKMASDMLKPLEALTRSLPPRPPSRPQWPSTGPPPPGATSEAQPAEPTATAAQENGNVAAPAAQPGTAPAAGAPGPSQGDAQMTEVEAEQESAAGPDALAAAEHAWAEQGRSERGRGGRMPRSMDAMIEDILEQAYEEGMQAYEDTHRLSEGESGSDGDDMSDDEDMHDDDDEASPSLESDHDHGESGEEDDDDPDDDDEDDRGSSDDSLSDHSFDHIDGEGDTDADAEAAGQVVIGDEEQDLLRLGEEVARFTDADLGMDMGMGMREEDEEDEHMQGMGDDDDQGSEGEEEDEDEEVDDEDAITDDEAVFEDGDGPSIWDDHRVIGGREEEDGDEMVAPRWAGMQRLPGTGNLHPAQVMQELLGNLTGQVATDRRRFRIISSRQGGRPQGPAPTMPAAAAPVQHRLLQRPTEDAEASAAARTDGAQLPVPVSYTFAQGMDGSGLRRLGGVNFPTEAAGPGGSVMVFQDPSLRGLAVGGQAARQPATMGGMAPAAMADFAMDLLLGGGGPARASSMRTSSWSDDGQQAAGGNAGATLAGTFERNLMEALRARTAAQAPAEATVAAPAAATEAPVAPEGGAALQPDGARQGAGGSQPEAVPSQPAAAMPSSAAPAEPNAAAEATTPQAAPSQPQQPPPSADASTPAEPPSAPASLPSLESSPADEDEEMMDAEEGDDGNAQAGGGEEISPAMAEAAAAVGIDLAFLQALPAELRGEVLAAHGAEMPAEAPAAPADPQAAAAAAATQLAQAAAAAFGLAAAGGPQPMEGQEASEQPPQPSRDASAPEPVAPPPADVPMESQPESEAAAAPSATPDGGAQQPSAPAQPAPPSQPEQPPDEMEGIDPEFIAALPPDIQAEVLEQQRRERRRRAAERQRAAAAQAAAAAGTAGGQGAGGAAPGPAEMDLATLLATFPPDVREEVLLSDDAVLSSLPPALLAEAQALRDRSMRFMSGMGRGLAGRHVHHIHELPIGRGGAQMGSAAMLGRALAGVGRGQVPHPPGDRSSAPPRPAAVGPPLVDEEDLSVLAGLLYMAIPSKTQLQRVFSNAVINHSITRSQALRILLSFLRSNSPSVSPRFGEPAPAAFGMLALQAQPQSSEEGPELEVSPPMSRRTLELLVYLARHQPRLAREIPFQLVPGPPTEQTPVIEDKKGKGKAVEKPHIPEHRAVEVLLTLLGLPLFRRSNAHLEQALQLLDTTFHAAYTATLERKRIQEANAKLEKDKEAAAKKLEEQSAQAQKSAEGAAQPSQSDGAQPPAPAAAQPSQDPQAAAGAQPRAASAAAGDQQLPPADSRGAVQPATASGTAADAGPLGSNAAAQPTPPSDQPQPMPEDPTPVLESVPEQLVRQLPQLLGQRGCTELAYSKCTAAMMHLVHCAKRHKAIMLAELEADLLRISDGAVAELHRLAQSDLQDPALGVDVGTTGGMVKRVLQAVAGLMKPPKESDPAQAAPASKPAPDPAASVPGGAASEAGPSGSNEQEAQDQGLVDRIAQRSSPLWVALSECIGRIEAGLKTPGGAGDSPATSRVLPPGAAQVLPLVEAFFVLCDARTAHLPPLPDLSPARSLEQQLPSVPSTPAGSAATPAQHPHGAPTAASPAVNEAHLPFLRFAEKHRKLLNTLLRVNSGLLEGSLKPLLKVPRLIDFDNKRSYFRSRARSTHHEERGHYGTLRINVRREHVFEDSFHQLRMKPPGEMRAKLSVQFHGEEGIDAGGVSREWYSVMAREIFNPNISLFIPLPEGGTTFQPNPNSIVQNDETRGTSHLDFFKFVGRIVGKALYDGQFIDAYFTRSFYKHMLMQPLTYQDIEAVDPEYFKNLAWMLENDITDILDLTFTEESDYFGKKELVELKPGGTTIKVTNANKREYVNLIAQHRMTTAIRGQINSFLTGFWDLIPKELISIFNDHELELLISGLPEIDVDDLRRNTEYSGYTAASKTIQWFWEVVQGLDKEDLALLVQFVTGTSKVPLDGFKALQGISGPQKFQIHKAYGPSARLPSAHTCFNQLDLLEYETQEQLKERLLLALHEGAEGFGFG